MLVVKKEFIITNRHNKKEDLLLTLIVNKCVRSIFFCLNLKSHLSRWLISNRKTQMLISFSCVLLFAAFKCRFQGIWLRTFLLSWLCNNGLDISSFTLVSQLISQLISTNKKLKSHQFILFKLHKKKSISIFKMWCKLIYFYTGGWWCWVKKY